MRHLLTRLLGALVLGIGVSPALALAATAVTHAVEVYHDSACGCCVNWIRYMRAQGYMVTAHETSSLAAVKTRLRVPVDAVSCHTAKIGGYMIEGHVPVQDIRRLLAERPDAIGLAAPGMPVGSPGMEVGAPQRYDVLLIGQDGTVRVYATHSPQA